MWSAKTQRKKDKILKRIFILLVLLTILSLTILISNWGTLTNRDAIISPLAKTESANSNLEKLLLKANVPFAKIQIATDSSYVVYLKDGGYINLSGQKKFSEQISSLQLILHRLTIEGKKFKSLDLRPDTPVIIF